MDIILFSLLFAGIGVLAGMRISRWADRKDLGRTG